MKIAISATGKDLNAQVDPAFGRCEYFIIYDSDADTHEAIPNMGSSLASGAGSTAVQTILEQGVTEIFTGKVGVKSRPILDRAGISISENQTGPIAGIIASFQTAAKPLGTTVKNEAVSTGASNLSNINPAGYCYCEACGYHSDGDPHVPCFKQRCPKCGCSLERKYR
jgi:predicted Fe-Mo cluster-binding NifX family protein